MEQKKAEEFAERILREMNGAMSCLNLYLGHRLNLFKVLSDSGPLTSDDLAKRTGYSERYMREWLECMASGRYVEYDAKTNRFSLPPEHAEVLLNRDSSSYAIPFVCALPSISSVLPDLLESFRNGGGVPYEKYGEDLLEVIGLGNRPMFVNSYVSRWIPAMPDVEKRLRQGGRVVDVGCGVGWSSIALAQGFPNIRIDGIDVDPASIKAARANAATMKVSDRVAFHLSPIEECSLEGPCDLVTAFECVHDMPYPVKALRKMRELAGKDGAVLVADERVYDTLEENRDSFIGNLCYNYSVLHCLPQAMVYPDAAGTGAVIKPSLMKKYAAEAGFSKVEILSIKNPLWRFYRLHV